MALATFGAGCFWGVEVAFRQVAGVRDAAVGYCGGSLESPTYQDVCSGTTGHAEVVEVDFDPEEVDFETLAELFWKCHDSTTLNRQGPDVGTQYRSAIFFHSPEQQQLAEASKAAAQQRISRPISTEITEASTFYRAEEYHQQYLEKRGQGSCHL
jgi:peptide-methionine (S)-S-oxide reductase